MRKLVGFGPYTIPARHMSIDPRASCVHFWTELWITCGGVARLEGQHRIFSHKKKILEQLVFRDQQTIHTTSVQDLNRDHAKTWFEPLRARERKILFLKKQYCSTYRIQEKEMSFKEGQFFLYWSSGRSSSRNDFWEIPLDWRRFLRREAVFMMMWACATINTSNEYV